MALARLRYIKPASSSSSLHQKIYQSSVASTYIIDKVKQADYETYLCLLLSPPEWRYPAFVLQAFNVEIAGVADSVSDTRRASGRFTFWKDAIERIFQHVRPYDHPVITELHRVCSSGLLPVGQTRKWLANIITSREQLCKTGHMTTVEYLEDYSERTRSSLNYLTLRLTGSDDLKTDHAASHLGKCQGLITALRATSYLASRNQILIPQDILTKHGVSQQDVLRGKLKVKEPAYDLACVAHTHLEKTKSLLKDVPSHSKLVFLPMKNCDTVLERLRQCDFNVFDAKFQRRNSLITWQLWWAKRKLL